MENNVTNKKVPQIRDLNELVEELRFLFQEDNVEVDFLQDLLLSYRSNPKDWKKYAFFDRHRYTRNLVDDGNGKYNLMILCWSEGQGSSIHDHPSQHCIMKILSGTLTETRFSWPEGLNSSKCPREGKSSELSESHCEEVGEGMQVLSKNDLHVNDVAYMSDTLGLHRMENKSHVLPCVSLHLYIPPYESCRIFDERTGRATNIRTVFHSQGGKRIIFTNKPNSEIQYENN